MSSVGFSIIYKAVHDEGPPYVKNMLLHSESRLLHDVVRADV